MAGSAIDVGEARAALASLPDGTSHGVPPAPEHVYLPRSHVKAMAPDCLLVTGMRGAGKTFWWHALQDGDVRRLIGEAEERPPLNEHTEVRAGFGVRPAPDEYPGKDTFRELINAGFEPRTVWRTIQAWHLGAGRTSATSAPAAGVVGDADEVRRRTPGGDRSPVSGTRRRIRPERRLLPDRLRRPGPLRRRLEGGVPGDSRPVANRCRDALVPESPGESLSALRSGRRRQRDHRLPGRLEGARLEGRFELAPP